jgi:membrane protease YdiL (CAAX protease family)
MALVLRLTMDLLALLLGWIPSIRLVDWGLAQYLIIGVFTFVGAVMEELGWRGYVLPKLLERRSALVSALIIGIPWGILHISLTLPGQMNAGTSWLATVLFLAALSVILTWFFLQTRGGIAVGIVYHAAQNYFVFLNGGIPLAESLLLLTVVTGAIAVMLMFLYGPGLQRSPTRQPAVLDAG